MCNKSALESTVKLYSVEIHSNFRLFIWSWVSFRRFKFKLKKKVSIRHTYPRNSIKLTRHSVKGIPLVISIDISPILLIFHQQQKWIPITGEKKSKKIASKDRCGAHATPRCIRRNNKKFTFHKAIKLNAARAFTHQSKICVQIWQTLISIPEIESKPGKNSPLSLLTMPRVTIISFSAEFFVFFSFRRLPI